MASKCHSVIDLKSSIHSSGKFDSPSWVRNMEADGGRYCEDCRCLNTGVFAMSLVYDGRTFPVSKSKRRSRAFGHNANRTETGVGGNWNEAKL